LTSTEQGQLTISSDLLGFVTGQIRQGPISGRLFLGSDYPYVIIP
jgi:hypothetical protein